MRVDRVRRAALAAAVVGVVGAIAASAGADPATNSGSAAAPLASGPAASAGATLTGTTSPVGPTGDVSGATGASGPAAGVTGATGATGAAGASQPSSPASGSSTVGSTTTTTTTTTTTSTSADTTGAGLGGPASASPGASEPAPGGAGSSASTGSKPAPATVSPATHAGAPIVVGSAAQPQTTSPGSPPKAGGSRTSSAANGPTAPSPALFDGANPLANVLPGSWDDPFIINGAADVPQFYVESFHIPPFLLSIYQAAGAAYDIPWQTLAAINEVETNYGNDLATSTAGAIGWMQFLPSTWKRYGVDASASGERDPYNAADAIFAAARYLAAAGGAHNLPAAIYAYNHSRSYVQSVLLRAELLTGEPSALVNSVSELGEGDFPIQLRYHASYGAAGASSASATATPLSATSGAAPAPSAVGAAAAGAATGSSARATIFADSGAAVVAVQDGTIVAIGHSRSLGRYVVLRNAFGDRFIYGNLASVSAWFPRAKPPKPSAALLSSAAPAVLAPGPHPTAPASAGAQSSGSSPAATLFRRQRAANASGSGSAQVAIVATINLRSSPSVASLFTPLAVLDRATRQSVVHARHSLLGLYYTGAFGLRASQLELAPMTVGSRVMAGTILGRLARRSGSRRAHLVFELRPAGTAEPAIDPRPFLDAWSQLETLELHHDSFNNPFYGPNLHAVSVGSVLRTSQLDIERIVLEDTHIALPACERRAIVNGNVDRRVLATLEVLVLHGIDPTLSGAWCAGGAHRTPVAAALKTPNAVAISELSGQPAAALEAVVSQALVALHGAAHPALSTQTASGQIVISFAPARAPQAFAAAASFTAGFALSAARWSQLDSRLLAIREPRVPTAVSAAALASRSSAPAAHAASRH